MPTVAPKAAAVKPGSQSAFTFHMVPSVVAADPELSPGGKLLFGAILSLTRAASVAASPVTRRSHG